MNIKTIIFKPTTEITNSPNLVCLPNIDNGLGKSFYAYTRILRILGNKKNDK